MENRHKETLVTFFSVVLVLIMLFVAVYVTTNNYRKEKMIETGKILCTQLMNASITYYREHGYYLMNDKVSFNHDYPFDARTNIYFSTFSTYSVPTIKGQQIILFFGSDKMKGYELRVIFDDDAETTNIRNIKVEVLKAQNENDNL